LAGSEPQPEAGLVVRTGAWIALQATVAFTLGLGVASLLGSRGMSIGVVLAWILALEPLLLALDVLGSIRIGLLTAPVQRLEPGGEPAVAMSVGAAVTVVTLWALVPVVVGAWRTATRDA
jgi:hypothetical protein